MCGLTKFVDKVVAFVENNQEQLATATLIALNVALCVRSYKMGKAGVELSSRNRLVTSRFWYNMGKR